MSTTTDASIATYVDASTLMYRYCRAIDDHDASLLRSVLADDCVLVVGEHRIEGGETVASIIGGLFTERDWARHCVTNLLVEGNTDDTIAIRAYVQFVMAGAERTSGLGDYRASMSRTAEGLRLTSLEVIILDQVVTAR